MPARYLLAWLLLAFVAVGNGVLRQYTYGKVLPELRAHQLSTLTAVLLTGVAIWAVSRRWPPVSRREAWSVGALWLLMTVAFEFLFGHYVAGHAWERLLADYDLLAGRLWLLFLIWIVVSPVLLLRRSPSSS